MVCIPIGLHASTLDLRTITLCSSKFLRIHRVRAPGASTSMGIHSVEVTRSVWRVPKGRGCSTSRYVGGVEVPPSCRDTPRVQATERNRVRTLATDLKLY
jgi:hypothetical protein